jgi:hypothetical protein
MARCSHTLPRLRIVSRRFLPIVLIALAGCGGEGDDTPPAAGETAGSAVQTEAKPAPRRAALKRARCAPGLANCRAASGTVTYVEAVDADGDGDAHFVLASRDSVTLPGITVIDCKRSLRPDPLPRVGDRVSAAGPVYSGSYGQKQIEATELHVARR